MSQMLKDATLFFLHGTPNLTMVIPAMDYIDESFTNSILFKDTVDPAIQVAIQLAKKTLNQYYTLTDASSLYCVSMGKFSSIHYSLLMLLQFCIPAISWSVSRRLGGSWPGLLPHTNLCKRHLMSPMWHTMYMWNQMMTPLTTTLLTKRCSFSFTPNCYDFMHG